MHGYLCYAEKIDNYYNECLKQHPDDPWIVVNRFENASSNEMMRDFSA